MRPAKHVSGVQVLTEAKQFASFPGTIKKSLFQKRFFYGADSHTPLELFEIITNHFENIRDWNFEMKEFLSHERKEVAFDIQF